MSFYRRARPAFNALLSAIHESTPSITRNSSSICGSNNSRVSGFGRFSLIPFLGGTRSCYYVDRYHVQNFKPSGLISNDIIKALQRGLSHEQVWSDPGYAGEGEFMADEARTRGTLAALMGKWPKDDEILDDKWVHQHLEVLVVNEPVVNAFCLPGGKIVVFTGFFTAFQNGCRACNHHTT